MKSITEISKVVEFVVDEVKRLQQLTKTDWKAAAAELGLSTVADHPLYEIAVERVENDVELNGRIEVGQYLHPLQVEIAKQCLLSKTPVTPELVQALFEASKDRAKSVLVDRTYFFPVYGLGGDKPDDFHLGAASFTKTKVFFERFHEDWQRSVTNGLTQWQARGDISEAQKSHFESLYGRSKEHYDRFGWTASVEIRQATPAVGRERARKLLEGSFNILRLLIPRRSGQFVGLPDECPSIRSEAWIARLPSGEFEASLASNRIETHAEEGFLERVRQRGPQIGFIENALRKQQHWQTLEVLESRLLTSLSWFGEAWKEQAALSKLLKLAISLEWLVMTGGKTGQTELLAERIAMLCSADTEKRRQLYDEVRDICRTRSKAVHGDFSEMDFPLGELNARAEKLCRVGLLSCADLFPALLKQKDQQQALAEFFTMLKLGSFQDALQAVQAIPQAGRKG